MLPENKSVSAENILLFLTSNATVMIQVLVTFVILLSGFLLYRIYTSGTEIASLKSSGDHSALEETLQKILEQQKNQTPAPSGPSAKDVAELESLREELIKNRGLLQEKDAEIKKLGEEKVSLEAALKNPANGAAAAPAPASTGGEGSEVLNKKIVDLEARLSEYEIITEDIADLSRLRLENEKLKQEILRLKSQLGINEDLSTGEPAAEEPALDPNLMAEFEAAVQHQVPALEKIESTTEEVTAEEKIQLLNQFENFVKKA